VSNQHLTKELLCCVAVDTIAVVTCLLGTRDGKVAREKEIERAVTQDTAVTITIVDGRREEDDRVELRRELQAIKPGDSTRG
jgi:hypothetical protein